MDNNKNNRREFIKKAALATAGVSYLGAVGFSAKSYGNIIGANDRLNVAIAGLGRRLGAFYEQIALPKSNVRLVTLCDVMKSQRDDAAASFSKHIDYIPKLENSIVKVIEDKEIDVLINATPDHWHAPISIEALNAGVHVYVEKPMARTFQEVELMMKAAAKHPKVVTQMGNQGHSEANYFQFKAWKEAGIIKRRVVE